MATKTKVLSIPFFGGEFRHADDTVSSATALADTQPFIQILRCFSKSAMAAPRIRGEEIKKTTAASQ